MRWLLAIILGYAAVSLLTFVMHWRDKRAATSGRWRVSEKSLHLLELAGGWPGAMLAQSLLRHKSRKLSYRVILVMIALVHLAAWAVAAWFWTQQ